MWGDLLQGTGECECDTAARHGVNCTDLALTCPSSPGLLDAQLVAQLTVAAAPYLEPLRRETIEKSVIMFWLWELWELWEQLVVLPVRSCSSPPPLPALAQRVIGKHPILFLVRS